MQRIILILICSFIIYMPAGFGGAKADYETAYKLYVAAGASAAAYDDRSGELANRYLQQDGWRISHYEQEHGQAGARYLIAHKEMDDGRDVYVVAIVGTETKEDLRLNLKVDKIYFAGAAPEEFAANAARKNMPDTEPKVHRGFHEFWQAGTTAKLRSLSDSSLLSLPDLLAENSGYRLILTGHSLGGAAATLAGSALLNMGVNPEQLEVITFGAPAVGNAAFVSHYQQSLRLTRVVIDGDPVTGVLQTIAGGYRQFGREIKWKLPPLLDNPHSLIGYVDLSIKNFYAKRQQAIAAQAIEPTPLSKQKSPSASRFFIAVPNSRMTGAAADDFPYMKTALIDEYAKRLVNYTFAAEAGDWRAQATAAGCRWAIVPEIIAVRAKQEDNIYRIQFTQTVYDVSSGAVVDIAMYTTSTYNLTPLEAFIHSLRQLTSEPFIRLLQT